MSNEELAVADRERILELWEGVKRFAWKQANYWALALDGRGGVTAEGLAQTGFLALLEAVETFDAAGGSFIGWYSLCLKGAFTQATGQRTKRDRMGPLRSAVSLETPLAEEDDLTLADVVTDPAAVLELEAVEERDRQEHLRELLETALAALPEEQAEAIRGKYYRGERADPKAHAAAMKALRKPVVSQKLREFL